MINFIHAEGGIKNRVQLHQLLYTFYDKYNYTCNLRENAQTFYIATKDTVYMNLKMALLVSH